MAATLERRKDPAAKHASAVDEQIAQATSRIRVHDLAFGGLLLAAMALVYATAMIVLDKYLALPEWVRQLALGGFLLAAGGVAYLTIIRPLRRRINPLYAAVQVEKTIDDAKNTVAGYVDAQERGDIHPTVKAAMSARAAKEMGKADLNRAVDHRSLIYTAAVGVVFLLALIVLFFVFRPTQFASLMGRTFAPFSSDPIATRTQLTLTKPEPPDPTITAGQPVTIGVHVGGRVPDPNGPEKVRVLLRHNPADPNYEELPMERVDRGREWEIRVPDYLVQNGFWYKVAAGDAVTPEYRVTVRSLPLFTDFEVSYEFPAYLRMKPATSSNTRIEAYRGTKVSIVARTNREVRGGRMVLEPGGEVVGKLVPGRPDSLRFDFRVADNATYRLHFTATTGEINRDPPAYTVRLIADLPPTVQIVNPAEDEIIVPANGHLAVDASIGDDFGIDKATLKLKIVGDTERPLADKPFEGGKSFRREADNSWPTSLEYKDSVDFTQLKDANGAKVELVEGMVIEYWLEAFDNCTEPKANVGKSAVKRVRVGPPKVQPEDKQNLDQKKADRKQEEKDNAKKQDDRLRNEERKPNPPPNQPKDGNPEPKKDEPQPKNDGTPEKKDGNPMGGMGDPMPKGDNPMGKMGDPMPKADVPPGKGDEMPKGMNDPMPKGDMPMGGMGMPMDGGMGGMKDPEMAPPPKGKDDAAIEKKANDLAKEIERENKSGGSGKPNPAATDEDRANPSDPKPNPMGGMDDSPPKPDPKQEPKDPMGGMGNGGAAETKPEGNLTPPPDPAAPKPDPKPGDMAKPQPGNAAENKPAGDPPLGRPETPKAEEKPSPAQKKDGAAGNPMPKDPMNPGGMPEPKPGDPKEDPSNGGMGKPAGAKPQPKDSNPPMGGANDPMPNDPMNPRDPAGGAANPKPMPEPGRGMDNTPKPADPKAGGTPEPKKPEEGGDAKPDAAPKPADAKPAPKDDMGKPMGGDGMTDPKPAPNDDPMKPMPGGKAAEAKPDTPQKKDGGTGAKPEAKGVEKGMDHPADAKPSDGGTAPRPKPKDKADPMGSGADPKKDPMGAGNDAKIDPKDIEGAVKDLTNPDPDKRKAAQDKLDKTIGPEKRKEVEDIAKGLQSNDPKEREAAKQKLDKMARDAGIDPKNPPEPKGGGGDPMPKADQPKIDPKDLADAAKDLTNPDPAKRKAAQEKLDKAVGPDARKEIEDVAKGLESNDPKEKAAAQEKLKEWQKKAEEAAKNDPPKDGPPSAGTPKNGSPNGKELSPKDLDDLAKKAPDLNSPDDAKRKAAEKEFDDKVGKEAREKMQDAMKDPKKMEELRKKFEEMAKKGGGRTDPDGNIVPKGGGDNTKLNPAMEDNPRNRAKSAELRLEDFKKIKDNPELQKRAGFQSKEEFDNFLEGYAKMTKRLQEEADAADRAAKDPATAPMPGTPTLNAGGGTGKVETRPGAGVGPGGSVGGPTVAPPGFGDAAKKFGENANKVTPKK